VAQELATVLGLEGDRFNECVNLTESALANGHDAAVPLLTSAQRLGRTLRYLRHTSGMTTAEISKTGGSTVVAWVAEAHGMLSDATLKRLTRLYHVAPADQRLLQEAATAAKQDRTGHGAVDDSVETIVSHFAAHGLTKGDYLRAAVKHPQLFVQRPQTFIANVEGVTNHFRAAGLTVADYLRAAIRHPQLFLHRPQTLIANVEGVTDHFRAAGLSVADYLRAAVRQPQLFAQRPQTIIGHVNLLIGLYHKDLASFHGQKDAPPDQPVQPLFAFLTRNPFFFCLADDNLTLRDIYAGISDKHFASTYFLSKPRQRVEADTAAALGHSDLSRPVPKELHPGEGGDLGPHARNLLLRALIREGIVKGTLER
jgi:hypothetical protein